MDETTKKPLTAYLAFAAEMRAERGLKGGIREQSAAISKLWAEVPDEEKRRRGERQRHLLGEWKRRYGGAEAKNEQLKEAVFKDSLAFRLFCVKGAEAYKRRTGKDLPFTLKVRSELEKQFAAVMEQFEAAAEDISERANGGAEINRTYQAWTD